MKSVSGAPREDAGTASATTCPVVDPKRWLGQHRGGGKQEHVASRVTRPVRMVETGPAPRFGWSTREGNDPARRGWAPAPRGVVQEGIAPRSGTGASPLKHHPFNPWSVLARPEVQVSKGVYWGRSGQSDHRATGFDCPFNEDLPGAEPSEPASRRSARPPGRRTACAGPGQSSRVDGVGGQAEPAVLVGMPSSSGWPRAR